MTDDSIAIEAAHQICKKLSKDYGVDCKDKTLSSCYRHIAKEVHPDKHPEDHARFNKISQEMIELHNTSKKHDDKLCKTIPEPKLIPRTNPTRGPPSPQSQPRPQEQDPYREAYEKTTSEVPKGAPFQDFKTRFIANLIPLVTKTSLALVAFGIVYVKLTGNSRSVPPGLNFGRDGGTKKRKTLSGGGGPSRQSSQSKITNLPNTNSRRLVAANNKYFSNRGTTPIRNASSRLNSARAREDYYDYFKINHIYSLV